MAQVNRMMDQYALAWSIYRDLLNECLDVPEKDEYNVFSEIATDMPYVESESAMEVWYPNVFGYLEYVNAQCREAPADKLLFKDALLQRYRTLGHAYWYLAHNKKHALLCYERWRELLEENDESIGELFMYLAHVHFIDDSMRAKSLYEQAIVELSIVEEMWAAELAICYSRLGYLQKRKRFFTRSFYLLIYVEDLPTLLRKHLEEAGECYLYLAKSYVREDSTAEKATIRQFCEQALRLFLNVKPPTSNFREMQDCAELLLNMQENNGIDVS